MKKQAMQTMKIIFLFFMIYILISTSAFCTSRYSTHMQEAIEIPNDLEACKGLISQQSATIATQFSQIEELKIEMEKLRKLLVRLLNGNRSEKHIVTSDKQSMLPFENEEELQAAKAEAEAQAESIIQKYTVEREIKKKRRSEALPSHLPRIEITVEVPESMKECPEHGQRTIIDYDVTEKLVHEPAKLFVEVRKYPKFACPKHSQCGLASPERPTGLVEGDKYDSSVAAAIIEAKWFNYMPIYRQQDIFAGSGWTPARSTLLNIVMQSAFVLAPLYEYMKKLVQGDIAVGIDDTGCRMLLPAEIPVAKAGDAKSKRLAEKVAEARSKGQDSLLAKMWAYSGLHLARFNIFDFRVSRHRDGPDEFFAKSRCKVQADCYSGNLSVVLQSDERLTFVACWAHARRKVVEAQMYKAEGEVLLGMIQALYDIERRASDWTVEERQQLRMSESSLVLASIRKWLDSFPEGYFLAKSDFIEAIRYLNNHWAALNVYVEDGRIPIDNNRVEQLMKQVALGRKAWLFVGNVAAGEQSAMMMSLVSSARRHDLNVWAYLKDVLDQLLGGSTDYASLLPDAWAKTHPQAIRTYRAEERRDKADRKQLQAAQRRLAKKPSH